ncbi:MAG TPA: hypothetical protein VIY68_00825 [Steroidobacteraceae bacterium]
MADSKTYNPDKNARANDVSRQLGDDDETPSPIDTPKLKSTKNKAAAMNAPATAAGQSGPVADSVLTSAPAASMVSPPFIEGQKMKGPPVSPQ